ncbi:MAG: ATP-binding protein [Spirochaetales bacterium]|nr:ATP-binding protein [Spirochaetales bacterium]
MLFNFSEELRRDYRLDFGGIDAVLEDFENFITGRFSVSVFCRALQCFCECVLIAMECGNENEPDRRISVWVRCTEEGSRFSVQDERGFRGVREPRSDENSILSRIRGLGFFLIKKLANRVKIVENKNMIICDIY